MQLPVLSNCRSAYQAHDHQKCIKAALTKAKGLCHARSSRLTPIREAILRLIWQSHKPLGAYSIVDQLPGVTGKRILAPTVYRSIEFLLQMGLIHRLSSLNAYIGCPFPDSSHSDIFLICEHCGCAAEFSSHSIQSTIDQTADRVHFQINSQQVEILGLCCNCQTH